MNETEEKRPESMKKRERKKKTQNNWYTKPPKKMGKGNTERDNREKRIKAMPKNGVNVENSSKTNTQAVLFTCVPFYNSGPYVHTANSLTSNHKSRTRLYGITLRIGKNAKNTRERKKWAKNRGGKWSTITPKKREKTQTGRHNCQNE